MTPLCDEAEKTDQPSRPVDDGAGLRRVGANAGWLMMARIVQAVLSIAYLAIATRTLGLADFGRFSLIVAIAQGISAVVGFQTWQFVVQYGTRAQMAGDGPHVDRIVGFAAVLDFAAAAVGGLLALLAILLLGPLLKVPHDLYGAAFGFCLAMLIWFATWPAPATSVAFASTTRLSSSVRTGPLSVTCPA